MNLPECMRLLGLGEAASLDQIKRAYRRLAQRLHPDKRAGDDAARREFIEVAQAYRTLVNAARAIEQGEAVGVCYDCREFAEVRIGMDGHARCGRCIFRPVGGRLLPLPVWVVARCTATFALLGAGVYLLTAALATDKKIYAAGAGVAGLAGLVTLAWTCLRIRQCLPRRDRSRMKREKAK